MAFILRLWASLFLGYLGLQAGCALHLRRPGFDLQVLKLIVIHGCGSISPYPFPFQSIQLHSEKLYVAPEYNRVPRN